MSSDDSLLSKLWRITRSHLDRQGSLDFHSLEYRHSRGNVRYDLGDFSSKNEEEEKSRSADLSIFSWVEALLEQFGEAGLGSSEQKELELNLIRLTAMWGHTNGLRINKHLEYLESIGDDYVLNHIIGKELGEKYSECGINSDSAEWLVSKLSGEELNLLIRDDFSEALKDAGVNAELLGEDQYAWIQKIKGALKDVKKKDIAVKNLLVQEKIDTDQNQSRAGEVHQILVTEGSLVLLNVAYLEVEVTVDEHPNGGVVEIVGCYCGASGDWRFFHIDEEQNATVFDEPDFDTHINDIWDYINQTEEARNALLDIDEEGNILSLSQEGEIFVEDCFDSESDDGIRYSKTAAAEYDYIYEIQGQWRLSFSMN